MIRVNKEVKDVEDLVIFPSDEITSKAKQINKFLKWKIDKKNPDAGPIAGQGPTIAPKIIEYKERVQDGKLSNRHIVILIFI